MALALAELDENGDEFISLDEWRGALDQLQGFFGACGPHKHRDPNSRF